MASAKYEILLQLATQQAEAASRQSADKIAKSFDNAWRRFASFEAFKLGLRTVENAHRRLTEGMEKNSIQMQRQADVVTSAFDRLLAAAGDLVGKNSGFTNYNQGIAAYLNSLTEWAKSEDGAKSIESWFNLLKQAALGLAVTLDSFVLPTMIAMVKVFGESPPIEEIMPDGSVRVIQSRGAQIVESLEKVQVALANARASAGQAFRGENVNFAPGATDVPLPPNYKFNREKELKELQDSISKGEAQIDAAMARMDKMVAEMFRKAQAAEKADSDARAEHESAFGRRLSRLADYNREEYETRLDAINVNIELAEQQRRVMEEEQQAIRELNELGLQDREEYEERRQQIVIASQRKMKQLEEEDKRRKEAAFQQEAQVYGQVINTFSGTYASIIAAAAAGNESLGEILNKAVGGMLVSMGTLLIQLGTVGVLAGALGEVIKPLAALTGGSLGVAAGVAAIAGGTAMVALGGAMGGGAAAGAGGKTTRPNLGMTPSSFLGGDPTRSISARRDGEDALRTSVRGEKNEAGMTVINVNFPAGIIVGNAERVGKEIGLALNKSRGRLSYG